MTLPTNDVFTCNHQTLSLTRRYRASNWHYARQCATCGQQVGSFVKKDAAAAESGLARLVQLPIFDEGASDKFWNDRWDAKRRLRDDENAEWWGWYSTYLRSPEWHSRAALVHARAGDLCEGCRRSKSKQVHHRTYAHAGNEFLFELVALCDACHDRIHADKNK